MNARQNIVALDAMGGDYGVAVNVEGAVRAVNEFGSRVILVGDEYLIKEQIGKYKYNGSNIDIYQAKDVIGMDEVPFTAVRQKKDSSIVICSKLVVEGKASAMVSAGNSGAVMASAMIIIRPLPDVNRPAITQVLPTLKGICVLLDVGANVICKPIHLQQFAIMGSIYAREIFGINSPRVGLLSIGEEKNKGNELTLQTYELLEKSDLNFVGNIEGHDIPRGNIDVAVCDGFVGNIILKFGEGVGEMLFKLIKSELKKYPIAYVARLFLWGALKDLRKRVDFEEYGGAPLLGINGICIICHGGSTPKAICNAIKKAGESAEKNLTQKISNELKKYL